MNRIFYYLLLTILVLNTEQTWLMAAEKQDFRKKAIIFGATGQDGTYLTELLLSKNYEVHGVARHASLTGTTLTKKNNQNDFPKDQYFFHVGDITNYSQIVNLIASIQPDEIYNLAAQSHVKTSFDFPEDTAQVNALGSLRILEAVRILGLEKKVKIFQAASGELFGLIQESPQTEQTAFHPHSPYGVAKLYGFWIMVNYRESYGIFACNGILFNHESPLRGEAFVTRKITLAACRHKLGLQDILYLGNLDAKRDWGYAKDYVKAMWLMLQQDKPEDYVIATGESHSVREFVELAFKELGIEIEWQGHGVNEYGTNKATGDVIVKIDPQYYRPSEVNFLLGKAEKAEKNLGWKPTTSFKELIKIMIESDYQRALSERQL